MAGTYPKNGPSKTNWEATRLESYGNQTNRKNKTTWQEDVMEDLRNQMAGAYPTNGPSKTNWESIRLESYGNQTNRKTKTTMARRCHGRSKKSNGWGISKEWTNQDQLGSF